VWKNGDEVNDKVLLLCVCVVHVSICIYKVLNVEVHDLERQVFFEILPSMSIISI
jgi:hypothetical protein